MSCFNSLKPWFALGLFLSSVTAFPLRVISLSPDVTEDLFAIGAGSEIVGVLKGCDYPAKAKTIPQVGGYFGLDVEKIIALQPDLMITWGHTFDRQLSPLHVKLVHAQLQHLSDVPKFIVKLGALTHHDDEANKVAKQFRSALKKMPHVKPARVFYQLASDSLYTVNKNSWINDALMLCGARNIFADAPIAAPRVTLEAVVKRKPDVIVISSKSRQWQHLWKKHRRLLAARFVNINPDLINRPGPRLVQGVRQLCEKLHG